MSIEAILNPADAVRGLYQQAGCPDTDGSDWGVAQYFEGLMTNPELASKVKLGKTCGRPAHDPASRLCPPLARLFASPA